MPAATQTDTLTRYTYTQYHMGIDARLIVYANDKSIAEKAGAAAYARIAELDSIMSDYRKDSELMKLCDKAGGPPVKVSDDLFLVLQRSRLVSQQTNGAFDITAGPVIGLWRQARRDKKLPISADIRSARRLVGWKKMTLDPIGKRVRLAVQGMKLDLGGIAKGYACDEAQKVLKAHGIEHALVEMGGDIVVRGHPVGVSAGWTIRVPNAVPPNWDAPKGFQGKPVDMFFKDRAISTSGDTEQFVVLDGKQYSHVVDPRTGFALTNRTQMTVIAEDGLTSDPLSTALTVLNPRERSRFLRMYPKVKVYGRTLRPGE